VRWVRWVDPIGDRVQVAEKSDTEGQALDVLLGEWEALFGTEPVSPGAILYALDDPAPDRFKKPALPDNVVAMRWLCWETSRAGRPHRTGWATFSRHAPIRCARLGTRNSGCSASRTDTRKAGSTLVIAEIAEIAEFLPETRVRLRKRRKTRKARAGTE
jgi:hypothetical protein